MSVTVQGTVPKKWGAQTSAHLTRRLQALEKAIAGGTETFLAPSVPTFGSGTITGGGGSGGSGGGSGTGITDHGALTGLDDSEDHSWAVQHEERTRPVPHQHGPDDLVGMEHRFTRRLEASRALPHSHTPEELNLDSRFYRRGERVPALSHGHVMADVSDLRPDDEQFILASRMFG